MNWWPALIYSGEKITVTIWLTVCIHIIYANFRIFYFIFFRHSSQASYCRKNPSPVLFQWQNRVVVIRFFFGAFSKTNSSPDCFCPKTDCFWSVGAFSGFLPPKEPQSKMFSSCNGISNSLELFHFRIGGSDILTGISQQSLYSL